MTTTMSWLPRVLRWGFTVFTVLCGIAAVAILVVMAVDPKLPGNANLGTAKVELMGLPGTIFLENSTLGAQLAHGGLSMRVNDAAGLFEIIKHTGLPVALLCVLYFMLLFELLRRLFRNVGRGESFTRPTFRLVQIIGFSLLGYSLVSAAAEGWFVHQILDYLGHHTAVTVSGMAVQLPRVEEFRFGDNTNLGSSYFFTGLLVLALSEVFRQGLALKNDSDLTI
ncbi:MAG: DUF2975 domain-containing protein [Rhizomicrobium sp.]|nr:DUF2975 domain-containing protein [Rhizomicrobium sp.]